MKQKIEQEKEMIDKELGKTLPPKEETTSESAPKQVIEVTAEELARRIIIEKEKIEEATAFQVTGVIGYIKFYQQQTIENSAVVYKPHLYVFLKPFLSIPGMYSEATSGLTFEFTNKLAEEMKTYLKVGDKVAIQGSYSGEASLAFLTDRPTFSEVLFENCKVIKNIESGR